MEVEKLDSIIKILVALAGADGHRGEDETNFILTKLNHIKVFGGKASQTKRELLIREVLNEIGHQSQKAQRKLNCRNVVKAAATRLAKASKSDRLSVYAHALDLCYCDGVFHDAEKELLAIYRETCGLSDADVASVEYVVQLMHFIDEDA